MFLLYPAFSNQHLYALSSKFDKCTQTRRYEAEFRYYLHSTLLHAAILQKTDIIVQKNT
jgi:hypothetical protein